MDSTHIENTDPVGFVRPEDRAVKVICVANMTDEEREEFFKGMDQKAREAHEERKKNGEYKRCHKTDWCRLEREKKEVEEKKKAERLATLEAREKIWEEDARKKEQEFNEYRELTDRRMEQLAGLVKSLLEERAPPQAAPPSIKRTKTISRQ